ncbi:MULTISPECIES: ATP-binding protein [unclassified Streptomyces]|uniref:ATP-binding protein n=1 Tax=unclassified Streptomyces TaxID=2593676 RepID=UPI0022594936|nr:MULTISPECIES: AAA family ATPase [unclassified Streptomyces]WSP54021.1 AAA family ATPase [Streptomyces sp. NBC_01241]WSU25303.1 AAA family ATPase [Streptomyces sp. NBC_01108]MCX4798621.1 AAA family ATPase [Streptomyces sp. NBC_01242]WSJ39834.1 AAA family ATPase [Streptomyces sp. NBC_01321]WSP66134.1 AAA family ATPase [Streptomyces sp. NBC_01240]
MRRPQHPFPSPHDPGCSGAVPGNLPAELNRFVGREDELAGLGQLLNESRLVTLVGVGGVGKTRCATRIAALTEKRYCDGVRMVELSAIHDAGLLEHALIDALGLTDHTSRPPRTTLLEHLAGRQLLLVIDGFEHLVDACAELVRELLRRAPRLRVLAAGRLPLELDGELTFPLTPMTDEDAMLLFAERAAAVRPEFRLTDGNRAAARELCRRLDGIPLALELAAGRLRALSTEQVLQRLDDRFRLLTGTSRSALARHQTLRTAIGWSHELCAPEQRLLWARLSVFAGQFDLEAVEYICSGADLPADSVLDVLTGLLTQSVVVREDSASGTRYRMLDTVREYGAEWLAATGDTDRLRRRHRDWFLGLATWCELDWFSPRQGEVAARVESELPNLRRAMEYSLESPGETHLAQYLAGTLWFLWVGCGRLSEGRHWLDHVLAEEAPYDSSRLKALWVLGHVAALQGDPVGAIAALQECRDEADRAGDATALAYAVHRTGCLALVTDDVVRAQELLAEALGRYREIGELNSNVLMARIELAMAIGFHGDLDGAATICEEVREVCEDHGEQWALSYALYVLAYAALQRGRPDRARDLLGESLAIGHAFHDLLGSVLALELLALATAVEGDAAEAAVLQGAADRIWPSVGLPLFGSAYYGQPRARCEELARRELGDGPYESGLRAGGRLDLDAAVARALASGPADRPRTPSRSPGPPTGSGRTRRPAASRTTGRGGPERW